jgi:hypothetical protein
MVLLLVLSVFFLVFVCFAAWVSVVGGQVCFCCIDSRFGLFWGLFLVLCCLLLCAGCIVFSALLCSF